MYNGYSQVSEDKLKVREIILKNPRKRAVELQPEVYLKDGEVTYKSFDVTFEGVIESHIEHHRFTNLEDVYEQWQKDISHF